MICYRCHGLMVEEELCDWVGGKGYDRSPAYRCIQCGDLVDPVILQHRSHRAKRTGLRKRQPRFGARVMGIRSTTSSAVAFSLQETAAALPVGPSKGGSMRRRVTVCCFCEKVRADIEAEAGRGLWQDFQLYMATHRLRPADVRVSHTYCPGCLAYYRNFLASSENAINRNETEGGHDGAVTNA